MSLIFVPGSLTSAIASQLAMQGFGHVAFTVGTGSGHEGHDGGCGVPCISRGGCRLHRLRLGDCSHDGSIAASQGCSGDTADVQGGGCSSPAAGTQQQQAPAALACLPSAAEHTQVAGGRSHRGDSPQPRTAPLDHRERAPSAHPGCHRLWSQKRRPVPLARARRWPRTPGAVPRHRDRRLLRPASSSSRAGTGAAPTALLQGARASEARAGVGEHPHRVPSPPQVKGRDK